ncbi:hypothetical protein SNE40_009910 [Patella caerulea]|uniref:Immunoglobulin I-set domain-containing protein n=1 Tax=Patella caerulea TaxID=87958 RepID=A0AAN8JU96_PATCE
MALKFISILLMMSQKPDVPDNYMPISRTYVSNPIVPVSVGLTSTFFVRFVDNPKPVFKWVCPGDANTLCDNSRVVIRNTNYTSHLTISDITPSDYGQYKLYAINVEEMQHRLFPFYLINPDEMVVEKTELS